MLALGFAVPTVATYFALKRLQGLFVHANLDVRLGVVERLVATPFFHHWHHSNEPEAWNRNYGVLLPLWDIAFGTCYLPRDRRPERYGIDTPMPSGVVAQLTHPFRRPLPLGSLLLESRARPVV